MVTEESEKGLNKTLRALAAHSKEGRGLYRRAKRRGNGMPDQVYLCKINLMRLHTGDDLAITVLDHDMSTIGDYGDI